MLSEKAFPQHPKFLEGMQCVLFLQLCHVFFQILLHHLVHILHTQQKQVVLAAIIMVHHSLGNSMSGADIFHCHLVISRRGKFGNRCLQNFFLALFLAFLLFHIIPSLPYSAPLPIQSLSLL